MNDSSRFILWMVLSMAVLGIFMVKDVQQRQAYEEHKRQQAAQQADAGDAVTAPEDDVTTPSARLTAPPPTQRNSEEQIAKWREAEQVKIANPKVAVAFSAYGGRIESWKIVDPRYSVTYKHALRGGVEDPDPAEFGDELILQLPDFKGVPRRPLEVSLIGNSVNYNAFNSMIWELEESTNEQGDRIVEMTSPPINDVRLIKTFRLPSDGYLGYLTLRLEKRSDSNIRVDYDQRGLGVGVWGPGIGPYEKLTAFDYSVVLYYADGIESIGEEEMPVTVDPSNLKWAGISNKYLIAGSLSTSQSAFSHLRVTGLDGYQQQKGYPAPYYVDLFVPPFTVAAKHAKQFEYAIFGAPKSRETLAAMGGDQELGRALFYNSWSWFRAICLALLWLLHLFHDWVGNWGLSIILLTVAMKIVTHPINHKALRINAEFQRQMAKIKPELDAIGEKYKDNFQEKQMAQTQLMRKHGINPLAPMRGCLPMLLQIPIFIGLYRILSQSIALRGEPFLWVSDLAMPDRLMENVFLGIDLNLLPLLMVGTQILSMKLSTRTSAIDSSQRMLFYVMPIVMLFFFYTLASGLFLYWVATNLWQIGHTLITNREVEHEAEVKEHEAEEQKKDHVLRSSLRERRQQARR